MTAQFPIAKWSKTPAVNDQPGASAPWTEGQPAGTFNNGGRDVMAAVREELELETSFGWFSYGNITDNPTDGHDIFWSGSTQFSVAGDKLNIYAEDRRVKIIGATTGTVYGTIISNIFSAGNTICTVAIDGGGVLVNEPLTVSVGNEARSLPVEALWSAGTRLPFYNTTPPAPRWSLVSGLEDRMLISEAVGGTESSGSTWVITGLTSDPHAHPGSIGPNDNNIDRGLSSGGGGTNVAATGHGHPLTIDPVVVAVTHTGGWRPPRITVCIGNFDG